MQIYSSCTVVVAVRVRRRAMPDRTQWLAAILVRLVSRRPIAVRIAMAAVVGAGMRAIVPVIQPMAAPRPIDTRTCTDRTVRTTNSSDSQYNQLLSHRGSVDWTMRV